MAKKPPNGLTVEEIEALTPEQIAALTPAEVADLSPEALEAYLARINSSGGSTP